MKKILMSLLFISMIPMSSIGATKLKCHGNFSKKDICIRVDFLKPANRKTDSTFKVYLSDKVGTDVSSSYSIESILWMIMKGGHEHGSEPVEITKMKDHFLVKNVWFMMLGDWSIKFSLKDLKGKILDNAEVSICLEKDPKNNTFAQCG